MLCRLSPTKKVLLQGSCLGSEQIYDLVLWWFCRSGKASMGTSGEEAAGCCGGDSVNEVTPLRFCQTGSYVYGALEEEAVCGPGRRVSEPGEQKK